MRAVRRWIAIASATLAMSAVAALAWWPAPSPSEKADAAIRQGCSQFWTLKTVEQVDSSAEGAFILFASYEVSARATLTKDLATLRKLKVDLDNADNKALDDLFKKAEDVEKATGGSSDEEPSAWEEAAERLMISTTFGDARDVSKAFAAASRKVADDRGILAAVIAAGRAIKACADDQREYLKTHPDEGARATGTVRFANGIDPTAPDRTILAGPVAGVYRFANCTGDGQTWNQSSGYLLRIEPNYAIGGTILFRGQKLLLNGYLNHDKGFNVTASQPPYTITLTGHVALDGGAVVIADGTIRAADPGGRSSCEGTAKP